MYWRPLLPGRGFCRSIILLYRLRRKSRATDSELKGKANVEKYEDPIVRDTLETIAAVKTIQQINGEDGCSRYIISQCSSAVNVLEVMALFLLGGWTKEGTARSISCRFSRR